MFGKCIAINHAKRYTQLLQLVPKTSSSTSFVFISGALLVSSEKKLDEHFTYIEKDQLIFINKFNFLWIIKAGVKWILWNML